MNDLNENVTDVSQIQIDVERTVPGAEETALIKLYESIDGHIVPLIKDKIDEQLSGGFKNYFVDLSDVEFLDSTGIGLFASLMKIAHARQGKLIFIGAEGQPQSVLGMVGFDALVTYVDTLEQAIEAVSS